MKFIIMFISLLMIMFGGLFMCSANDKIYNDIKNKVNYEFREPIEQAIIDGLIENFSKKGLIAFIIGMCLFITSLFL